MHSSLINKISILRPRKKTEGSKQFTITNSNCHASLTPKETSVAEEQPPPLIPKSSNSNESDKNPGNCWVPVYIVNVPKTAKDSDKQNSDPNKNVLENDASKNPEKDAGLSAIDPVNKASSITKKDGKAVSCFICPSKFPTVESMQDHYLETHKKVKRTNILKKNAKDVSDQFESSSDLSDEGEPKCPICSIGFKSKEEVQEHMGSVHCYDCSECNNTFYTLFQFTDHKCVKVIRPKRQKLKKKKVSVEKDPLALAPHETNVKSPSTNTYLKAQELKNPSIPPVSLNAHTTSSHLPFSLRKPEPFVLTNQMVFPTLATSKSQTDPLQVSNIYTAPLPSLGSNWREDAINKVTNSSHEKFVHKDSMLDYSYEQLTSKEVVEKKLDEILKNPSISLHKLSKEKLKPNAEFFSCGRCNVLCEDHEDYLDHLEECLRLSNVSIAPSSPSSNRILKLRSELIYSKKLNYCYKSSINKTLLKEIKNSATPDLLDSLMEYEESIKSDFNENLSNSSTSDKVNNCVKLNESVSIKKIPKNKESLLRNKNKHANLLLHKGIYNGKQPMVIIPLNKECNPSLSCMNKMESNKEEFEDHYPDISITDKNNSVVYKFAGTRMDHFPNLAKTSPIIHSGAVQTNMAHANVLHPRTSSSFNTQMLQTKRVLIPVQLPSNLEVNNAHIDSTKISEAPESHFETNFELKEEPLTPNSGIEGSNLSNPDSFACDTNQSPLELVLDDEDIKMEIEDEVVDDKY